MKNFKKEKLTKIYFWTIHSLLIVFGALILSVIFADLGDASGILLETLLALNIFIGVPLSIIFFFLGIYILRVSKEEDHKKVWLYFWMNIAYIIFSLLVIGIGLSMTYV